MTRDDYRPSPPADVTAVRAGDRWTVVFVRELKHPPEAVWRALTDPGELKEWSPFDTDRNLGTPGDATLSTVLRWELEPVANGTRLTLRHSMQNPSWMPKVTAGWHICLDILDLALSGQRIGRIVGADAKAHWEPLNEEYAKRLNVE